MSLKGRDRTLSSYKYYAASPENDDQLPPPNQIRPAAPTPTPCRLSITHPSSLNPLTGKESPSFDLGNLDLKKNFSLWSATNHTSP